MGDRILRIRIEKKDENLTVEQYLKKNLEFSKKQISRLKFREDGIRVDDVRQRVTKRLREGEYLEILLESCGKDALQLETDSGRQKLYILYEDADLLIVRKPSGLVCHPSHGHYQDTLANQAAAYGRERRENWTVRIIGRLDKDTSGIVVFAKNAEAAALLARQRERGIMKKTYLALVEGKLRPSRGCIEKPIARNGESLMKMRTDGAGKSAKTWYQVVEEEDGQSLVQVQIEHGRTHQIRVHMASAGHPLVGDPLYGTGNNSADDPGCASRHAWKLELSQPFTGKRLLIEAPLPEWCRKFCPI